MRAVIHDAIDSPARELMFLPVTPRIRHRAQAIVTGAISPAGQGLAALSLLAVAYADLGPSALSWGALMISAGILVLAVAIRPLYRKTLGQALHKQQLASTDVDRLIRSPDMASLLESMLCDPERESVLVALDLPRTVLLMSEVYPVCALPGASVSATPRAWLSHCEAFRSGKDR